MRFRPLLLVLPLCVVAQVGSAQQPAAQAPGAGAVANVRSPEVAADRRVTFRIAAPKAAAVSVICECLTLEEAAKLKQQIAQLGQRPEGDPEMTRLTRALAGVRSNQGERAMTKDANGVWTLTLPSVEADLYEYHFKVDDFEMLDPRNPVVKYNSRPNLIESVLEVPGASPMFYDVKAVPHGKVDIRYYDSKATGGTRRAFVYTPPGYEKSTAKLPVLYLLHGADGDETVWTTFGRMNLVLDNMIADKRTAPMIVVTPAAYAYPPATGVAGDKQRADFEKDLLGDLIPFVQANYRAFADRDHRALAGLSMGGGLTLAIGPRHLDTFSRLAVFSAGAGQNPQESMKDVAANAKNMNAQLKLFWMAIGDDDPGYLGAKRTSEFLTTAGIKHSFKTSAGAHTWIVWRRYLNEVGPQLWASPSGTN
ncbi:MAG: alpha/beta hydrolase-fold protein [Vicinamibacterales bacterium]|nr:alpha/beta hydrolase-fold protein [Vicinamibacterales bacterium]